MKKCMMLLAICPLLVSISWAQRQSFEVTIENVGQELPVLKKGVFNTPIGSSIPAPIFAGEGYEFSFTAGPGKYLSFAMMFVQSNDLFYAFPSTGLALFNETGTPVTGDVTDQVFLYDAGTEINEEPGAGPNQAPRQSSPDTGADENGVITRILDGTPGPGGFTYPDVADIINVAIAHDGGTEFTVTITNVSTQGILQTSGGNTDAVLAPGIWAVHSNAVILFEPGQAASQGIESIAEDGSPGDFDEALTPITGVQVPLSPGAWAVHSPGGSFFSAGTPASAGIEALAEYGNASILADEVSLNEFVSSSGVFNTPDGSSFPGVIGPGGSYTFFLDAEPGDLLSFATMFIQANDFFFAPANGIPLFNGGAQPIQGNVTDLIDLWDAGTEVDEEPGVGPNQAVRQSGIDDGINEGGTIVLVDGENDGYLYPSVNEIIQLILTPIEPTDTGMAPSFTGSPITTAHQCTPYQYTLTSEGTAPITYSLEDPPPGMTVDSTTGLIQWTPSLPGTFSVTAVASNSVDEVTNTFSVAVDAAMYSALNTDQRFLDFSESSSYRLLSVPGMSTIPIENTFSGNHGLDWRAFWDNGELSENSEDYLLPFSPASQEFEFKPGRGFWD